MSSTNWRVKSARCYKPAESLSHSSSTSCCFRSSPRTRWPREFVLWPAIERNQILAIQLKSLRHHGSLGTGTGIKRNR